MPEPSMAHRIKEHIKVEVTKAEEERAAVDTVALYPPGDDRRVQGLSYGWFNVIQAEARKHALQELDRWITGQEISDYYARCHERGIDSGD